MFCKVCGKEISGGENFCSNCGASVFSGVRPIVSQMTVRSGFADPRRLYASSAAKIFGAVCAFVFGIGMIGGGVYGIAELITYTDFVIVGSVCVILGGIGLLIHGGYLLSRLKKDREENKND